MALVQVLLVTAIIMLLVIQLSLTAQGQVGRAQALKDRTAAYLYLHSREVAMLYTLLTQTLASSQETSNPYAAGWNFHGEPFVVDGLEFTLQDQSGLMRFPIAGTAEFRRLLETLGLGTAEARTTAEGLGRWIGLDARRSGLSGDAMMRGGTGDPVQYFGEMRFLPGMDEALYGQLAKLMTMYPTPGFNPLTAPAALLRMQMPETTLQAVVGARRRGELDENRFWQITGIGADEATVPIVGPGIGIRIEGEHLGVTLRRRIVVGVRPYDVQPLDYWSREQFSSGIPK